MPYSYRTLTETLTRAGIDEASDEALLILTHTCGVTASTLFSDRDRIFDDETLEELVRRRCERYPLQYLFGEWDFFGCCFHVNEHCLIPRPDTEILVEEAIRLLPQGAHVVDLCTGSGCIAVATLHQRLDVTVDALELYPETLDIATRNAEANGVANRFTPILADLLQGGAERLLPRSPYDAVLSNPPYIRTTDIPPLAPEVHYEPVAALDGGEDGLIFYRAILRSYAPLVKPGGHILFEIGYDQANDLRTLVHEYVPDATVRILSDLAGNDRVVVITLPEGA